MITLVFQEGDTEHRAVGEPKAVQQFSDLLKEFDRGDKGGLVFNDMKPGETVEFFVGEDLELRSIFKKTLVVTCIENELGGWVKLSVEIKRSK